MLQTLLILLAIAAAVAYVLLLAYRIGLGAGRHARVWSPPRPLRLLSHGEHERPKASREPKGPASSETAVAA
jgi:hypothetical protein